jgi:hypothetical protein
MVKDSQITMRIEPEVHDQLEELAVLIGKHSVTGTVPAKAEVARSAMLRGMRDMTAELKGKPRKRK